MSDILVFIGEEVIVWFPDSKPVSTTVRAVFSDHISADGFARVPYKAVFSDVATVNNAIEAYADAERDRILEMRMGIVDYAV